MEGGGVPVPLTASPRFQITEVSRCRLSPRVDLGDFPWPGPPKVTKVNQARPAMRSV
ncbi:hypothetical protein GCM10010399_41370 [Dactylosporangium fulvum]